ncbi:MAG: succinylglutamate desuccinylase/aspartoacylase family protein [Phycisphaerales bacterium JB047]
MTEHTRQAHEHRAGVDLTRRELGHHRAGRSVNDAANTTLVIVAGMHGNEPAGAHAAHRVLDTLQQEQPSAFDGELVVLLGNLAALNHEKADARYIEHDLNRLFTDEQIALPPETSPEHGQMQELLASLRSIRARCQRMVVVDLHTTSADMPPVVVLEDSIPTRRMARKLPLPLYLGFEEELGGLLIDRTTSELGAISMVIEGGQHNDPMAIDVHEAVIWSMLDACGVLPLDAMAHEQDPRALLHKAAGNERGRIFDVRYRYPICDPDFCMCPGIEHGDWIRRESTPVATELGSPVTAPVHGIVFMPNMQTIKRVGDDGFFIVRPVGEGWLGLSARLRRQRWLHWLIAHMPGVYACDDHTLCVDADLAAVLRRQVLHLLGYRLVRHDERRGGHGLMRVIMGFRAFFKALFRGPIPGGPDQTDPRFWIVRRHKLDG